MASGISVLVDLTGSDTAKTNKIENTVDIIAIHGLGADPQYTWVGKGPNGESVDWLADSHMLPKAVPNARIMRFGYESGWYGHNPKKTYVADIAGMLLKQLELHRRHITRPIVFIAHSYGGLVLMQALRKSYENPDKWSNPFRYTAGIVLFGAPIRGRYGLTLAQIVEAIAESNPDLKVYPETMALSVEGNPYLEDIVERYTETRLGDHPTPLCCFYETKPSPIGRVLQNENLKSDYLIPKASACLDISKGVEKHALERHHYNLQKFAGPSDPGYRVVEHVIVGYVNGANEYLRKCTTGSEPIKGHFSVPFGRNEDFVGRDTTLNGLLERLPPASYPDDCQITTLEGLGGVGKTQIALEAAFRVRDAQPDCSIFWIAAIDPTSLYKAYREMGQVLGLKGLDDDTADVHSRVHAALAQNDISPWLLIIDNADDQELLFEKQAVLRDLPFNRNGSILVTTRNHEISARLGVPQQGLLKVQAMPHDEAKNLLCQGLRPHQTCDVESVDKLLAVLTYLPLAVRQASAYMNQTGLSASRYLVHHESSEKAMFKLLGKSFYDRGRYTTAQNAVVTTWLISFEHLTRDEPLAADYLQFISFLSEKNIPRSLLPEGDDELEEDEAFGTLKAYAFITERMDTGWFDVHRLVRLVMQNWLKENGEQARWLSRVIERLNKFYPIPQHYNKESWLGYLPQAQATLKFCATITDESNKCRLLQKVGGSLSLLGQYVDAEAMCCETLKLSTRLSGIEHPHTVKSKTMLADVILELGRYAEAGAMYDGLCQLQSRLFGDEHPDTLSSMTSVAYALSQQGEYKKSEEVHRKVLALKSKVLGSEHPDTIGSMSKLALVLNRLGRYQEAESMHRRTLQLHQKVLGADHPDTLSSMNNLALVLDMQGHLPEAEDLQRKTLESRIRVLGPKHPNTATSLTNLASILYFQDRYAEAEAMMRQTLLLSTEILGARHPDTIRNMNNLARALDQQQKYVESEKLHQDTLQLWTEVLGPEHPDTLTSMHGVARVIHRQNRYAEAQIIYRKTLCLKTKVLGAEHHYTIATKNDLAAVLQEQGV